MKNKKLLYGGLIVGAVVVLGLYFHNKGFLFNKKTKTYSEECQDSLNFRLMQDNVKPPNFEKDFLERCAKNEKK